MTSRLLYLRGVVRFFVFLIILGSVIPTAVGQDWQAWEAGWSVEEKKSVQESLVWAGTYYGLIDGQFGRLSRTAISDWQAMRGYPATGYLTPQQADHLIADAATQRQELHFAILLDPVTTFRVGFPYALMNANGSPIDRYGVQYTSHDGNAIYVLGRTHCPTDQCWSTIYQTLRSDISDIVYDFRNDNYISINGIAGNDYIIYFARREMDIAAILKIQVPRGDKLWLSIAIAVGTYFDPFNNRGIRLAELQPPDLPFGSGTAPQSPSGSDTAPAPTLPVLTAPVPALPEPELIGSGSGFVIDALGRVVTAHHVIQECADLVVVDSDRQETPARVTASDSKLDLAVLSTDRRTEDFARFRVGQSISLGADVIALGYPLGGVFGSRLSATRGSISSLAGIADNTALLTLTAPIQPGNSGGPLLDIDGLLVGVVVATLDAARMLDAVGSLPQNVNFAVKSLVLQTFLDANGIAYAVSLPDPALDVSPEEIIREAVRYTVRIDCYR